MYIDSPLWNLKQSCPCCGEVGSLELYTCNECQHVIAICSQMLTLFPDPLDISLDKIVIKENKETCPHCNSMGKLRRAKDYEIIALGFTQNDYE